MVEIFLVSMVLLLTGFGFYRLMRAEREARRYLESSSETPLQLSHLSSALARVARETRTLRISLESPLRTLREYLRTDPTRTEDDLEAVDAALMEATRGVGEWLAMIDALPAHERGDMEAMGASAGPDPLGARGRGRGVRAGPHSQRRAAEPRRAARGGAAGAGAGRGGAAGAGQSVSLRGGRTCL